MYAESQFNVHMRNYIAPFEEIIGVLKAIETTGSEVSAILTCTYSESVIIGFPKNTLEAKILEQKLSKLLGQKVAILRIPDSKNPLRIRKVEKQRGK